MLDPVYQNDGFKNEAKLILFIQHCCEWKFIHGLTFLDSKGLLDDSKILSCLTRQGESLFYLACKSSFPFPLKQYFDSPRDTPQQLLQVY